MQARMIGMSHLLQKIKATFEESFPDVQLSRKRAKDKPWVTTEIKKNIIENHRLYKLSIRYPSLLNYQNYKDHNYNLKRCLKLAETS